MSPIKLWVRVFYPGALQRSEDDKMRKLNDLVKDAGGVVI